MGLFEIISKLPLPFPIPGPIISLGLGLLNRLLGSDDHNSDPGPYREEAAQPDETVRLNRQLDEKRSEFAGSCRDFEEHIAEAAQTQFDWILGEFETMKTQTGLEMQTVHLEKRFSGCVKEIRGGLSGRINQHIGISDSEYASILRETNDAVRSGQINRFYRKVIRNGFEDFFQRIEDMIGEAVDYARDIVENKVREKRSAIESIAQDIDSITRELSAEEFAGKQQEYSEKCQKLNAFLAIGGVDGFF